MVVEEKCIYAVAPDNREWTSTLCDVRVYSNHYLKAIIEKFGIERFRSNIKKSRAALQHTLDDLFPVCRCRHIYPGDIVIVFLRRYNHCRLVTCRSLARGRTAIQTQTQLRQRELMNKEGFDGY